MFPAAKRILLPSWLLALWIIAAVWTCLPDASKNSVWKIFYNSLQTSLPKVIVLSVNQQDKIQISWQIASEQTYGINWTDPTGRFGKAAVNTVTNIAANPRVQGGIQALGGVGGMAAGAALVLTPEPTMLTKVGGVAAVGVSADFVSAGARQMWSGQSAQTLTAQAVSGGLQGIGVNAESANRISGITENTISGVLPLGIAGKAAALGAAAGKQSVKPLSNAGAMTGVLQNANYAQRTFSPAFSSGGTFAGQTVQDVANALRAGTLRTADVPIQYIVKDGNVLLLNTRSAQALEQAGISRSVWNAIDMTGDAAAQARLAAQLRRSGLGSEGITTVTPSGH